MSAGKVQPLLIGGLLVFVFLSGFFQVSDVDVGYHMRTAAHILAGNGIPTTNTFSATTPKHPWLLHQWLGTLIFYLPFKWAGVTGLITFKALAGVLIMLLAWLRAKSEAGTESWWPFWTVTAGVIAARVRFFERPDLLSALFFALILLLDGRLGTKRRWQWLGLPLLMAAWANVHAGVIYGFALLAVLSSYEWLEWIWNKLTGKGASREQAERQAGLKSLFVRPLGGIFSVAAACLTVQLINPNGCRVLWFPISQFASPFWQDIIVEYHSPTWSHDKAFYLFLAWLIVLQLLTIQKMNWRRLLVSAVFGFLACRSQRCLLFFIIVAIPHAAVMLEALLPHLGKKLDAEPLPDQEKGNHVSRWLFYQSKRFQSLYLIAVWMAVTGLVYLPDKTFRFGTGWYQPYYPLDIYQFVEKNVPPQNLFNDMRYGGSLMWWLYPRFRPFIDGRGDAYSEEFWQQEYLPVMGGKPVWRDVFKRHEVHAALLAIPAPGKVYQLAQNLFDDPQWALVAYNDDAMFFLERTETNNPVIAAHQFKFVWPGDWSFAKLEATNTHTEAINEIKRAFENAPDSLFAQTAMASLCMRAGQFNEAAQLLAQIIREHDAGYAYWRDYGYALFRLGRFDEADRIFSRMIRKNQMAGYAYFMKHAIALEQRNGAAAQRFLSSALEIEPDNPDYKAARANLEQSLRRQ